MIARIPDGLDDKSLTPDAPNLLTCAIIHCPFGVFFRQSETVDGSLKHAIICCASGLFEIKAEDRPDVKSAGI